MEANKMGKRNNLHERSFTAAHVEDREHYDHPWLTNASLSKMKNSSSDHRRIKTTMTEDNERPQNVHGKAGLAYDKPWLVNANIQ
jgi:hypothetical protein